MNEELVEQMARRMNKVRREAYLSIDPMVPAPDVERAAAITKAEVNEVIRQMEWARRAGFNVANQVSIHGFGPTLYVKETLSHHPLTLAPEDWQP
jgi:hypothetical protein